MRKPRPVATVIDAKRIKGWVDLFASYRHAVTASIIDSWLEQFDPSDRDAAARILDAVDFYGTERIVSGFRSTLASLSGWHANPNKREGRWRFVAYSGSAGESGDAMIHQFRLANRLDARAHKELFIHRSDLMLQDLGPDDTVVLIDDLTATGDQVVETWNEVFSELLVGVGRIYLAVVAAGHGARKRVQDETPISLVPSHQLVPRDGLFAVECNHFSPAEKDRILHYSTLASKKLPKGYGECGYLLVFHHRCPNNSVAILHESNSRWTGLFPRHD